MTKRFENKTAVITGGCRGIGKAIAKRYAMEGARIFALDYVIPDGSEPFFDDAEINSYLACIQCDVTDGSSVRDAFARVVDEAGGIDILVNNAGITRDGLLMRMSESDWDSVISTNLKGAFNCTKAVCRTMMSQRQGRIINMGSVVGSMGNAGQSNYSASKAGLIGLTKSTAKELAGRNILVNLIAPGYVRTPMTDKLTDAQREIFLSVIPLKRAAEPSDIANVAAFLASDDSSYITGQVFHVDGGMLM